MFCRFFALLAVPVMASGGTIVQSGHFSGNRQGGFWPLDHFVTGQRLTHVEAAFHLTYRWGVTLILETEPGIPLDPPALVVSEGWICADGFINPGGCSLHAEKRCEYRLTESTYTLPPCEGEADFVVVGDPNESIWSTFDDPPIRFGLTAVYGDAWCEPGGYLHCSAGVMMPYHDSAWVDYTLTYTYVDPSVPEPGTGALVMASLGVLAIGAWRRGRGSR